MINRNDYFLEAYGDDLYAIEEAYKGKSKQLLDLEKMIGENRKKYYNTFKVGGSYYTDPDFEKIGDKIASIFGFKYCDFNLVNDPSMNAFTVPCGFSITNNSNGKITQRILTDKDNIKYDRSQISCIIRLTSGLYTNKTFTDGEIMGLIIHEVGHNFQHGVNNCLKMYSVFMYFMNMASIVVNVGSGNLVGALQSIIMKDSEVRSNVNKWAKKSNLGGVINVFGNILGFIRVIISEVLELTGRLTLGIPAGLINIASIIATGVSNPLTLIVGILSAPIKKGAENVSDDFAASHGYGAELISALSKIDLDPNASATEIGKFSKKLPLFDSVCTLFALPTMIISQLFSDHPLPPKRATGIVAELKRELNKSDVSPKVKKEIEMQIKEVEDAIRNMSKSNGAFEGVALRKALYRFQLNFDKDPRKFIQKAASKKNLIEAMMLINEDEYLGLEESVDLDDVVDDMEECEKQIMDEVMESDYGDLFS